MSWRSMTESTDSMLDTADEGTLYAAGWTISGVATLAAIVAVWMFGM